MSVCSYGIPCRCYKIRQSAIQETTKSLYQDQTLESWPISIVLDPELAPVAKSQFEPQCSSLRGAQVGFKTLAKNDGSAKGRRRLSSELVFLPFVLIPPSYLLILLSIKTICLPWLNSACRTSTFPVLPLCTMSLNYLRYSFLDAPFKKRVPQCRQQAWNGHLTSPLTDYLVMRR